MGGLYASEQGFFPELCEGMQKVDGGSIVEEGAPEAFFAHPRSQRAVNFLQSIRAPEEL